MKAKRIKFISLFLAFTLLTISCASLRTTFGKKRRGAKLIITDKNGQQVKGELITAKQNSLLILVHKEKDVSVDIKDIDKIVIVTTKKMG